jgi:hypothetical protein
MLNRQLVVKVREMSGAEKRRDRDRDSRNIWPGLKKGALF